MSSYSQISQKKDWILTLSSSKGGEQSKVHWFSYLDEGGRDLLKVQEQDTIAQLLSPVEIRQILSNGLKSNVNFVHCVIWKIFTLYWKFFVLPNEKKTGKYFFANSCQPFYNMFGFPRNTLSVTNTRILNTGMVCLNLQNVRPGTNYKKWTCSCCM